jgi:hypothetical protein
MIYFFNFYFNFIFYLFIVLLFICAYKDWVISPPSLTPSLTTPSINFFNRSLNVSGHKERVLRFSDHFRIVSTAWGTGMCVHSFSKHVLSASACTRCQENSEPNRHGPWEEILLVTTGKESRLWDTWFYILRESKERSEEKRSSKCKLC